MNFNFNIKNSAKRLIPFFMRQTKVLSLLYSGFKGLQNLVNDNVAVTNFGQLNASFYQFTEFIKRFLSFNSQTLFLEKYLNDEYVTGASKPYDNSTPPGIYIDNSSKGLTYLYNFDEPHTITYGYSLWKLIDTYAFNDYLLFNNKIWKSLQGSNQGNQPGSTPLFWEFFSKNINYNFDFDGSSSLFDFIVYVPSTLTYNDAKMRAQIDQYRVAPRTYKIITY